MSLRDDLEQAVKEAMRSGDATSRDTLRMVLADLKSKEVLHGGESTDEAVLGVLAKAVKTRRESIEQFDAAGRKDLADVERAQVAVLERYLPKQLSEDEVREVVRGLIAELGVESKRDMGKLMKELTRRHKGSIDGRLASGIVGELLG